MTFALRISSMVISFTILFTSTACDDPNNNQSPIKEVTQRPKPNSQKPKPAPSPKEFEKQIRPFLIEHCSTCHGPKKQKGDLRLDTLSGQFLNPQIASKWREVVNQLNLGEMPPKDKAKPPADDQQRVIKWLSSRLNAAANIRAAKSTHNLMRRMTRTEYSNTVRDLLHVKFLPGESPMDLLPPDGRVMGFDKVSRGLTIDPSLMDAYLQMASTIADKAIVKGAPPVRRVKLRFEFEKTPDNGYVRSIALQRSVHMRRDGLELMSKSAATPPLRHPDHRKMIPRRGMYKVRVRASADMGKPGKPVIMKVWRGGDGTVMQLAVDAPLDSPKVYEITRAFGPTGNDSFAVLIENGTRFGLADLYWHEMENQIEKLTNAGDLGNAGRLRAQRFAEGATWYGRANPKTLHTDDLPKLFLDYIEIEGPLYDQWPPRSHQEIFFAGKKKEQDLNYARQIFERLLPKAYRRHANKNEVDTILKIVRSELDAGKSFEESIKAGVTFILCSPSFLYLYEHGHKNVNDKNKLSRHELATRLSYFVWSSAPDASLMQNIDAGKLESLADGMLADSRAEALVTDFARQWLRVDEFDRFSPDPRLYSIFHKPQFFQLDDDLKNEPLAFFRQLLNGKDSVTAFINADWTMLNERLAAYYGVNGVRGNALRRVSLPPNSLRGGLLAMAGLHRWGSDGNRTLPVHRGVYIRDVLFNDPPKPPPPNAGEVEPNVKGKVLTVRQRLEAHRQIESCAACHNKIDPYGLALENFNAIGKWRDRQDGEIRNWAARGGAPRIDSSGVLPNGHRFTNFKEFKAALMNRSDLFVRGLTQKLFIYALGRPLRDSDHAEIKQIMTNAKRQGTTLRNLIKGIIHSKAFQMR